MHLSLETQIKIQKVLITIAALFLLIMDYFSPWRTITKHYPVKGPIPREPKWKDITGDPNSRPKLKSSADIVVDAKGMYFIERSRIPWFFLNRKAFAPWESISTGIHQFPFYKIILKGQEKNAFVLREEDLKAIAETVSKRWPGKLHFG